MLLCSPHGKRVAWKTGQPFQAGLPVNANWTGQIMCPLEKFWWGESDLDSPLARLAYLVRNAGTRLVWNRGAPPVEMDSRSIVLGRDESVAHASSVRTK